ncbi:MAG TPA: secretin N-terminal domain-containing protein [Pyrinomonadaceae bacterium]|nr:secretin N-terminal domain-containing protein [Pyrinomonadaceae bacterium]
MKSYPLARPFATLVVAAALLLTPLSAMAKKGDKNYDLGVEYEKAQQWEKAAQEFALAVAADPSNTQYQLHYRRSVFNASQVYMTKGRALADQGDYIGAYNAFRQAYGLDPVNNLAAQEMDRMLNLQREKEGATNPPTSTNSPATYRDGQQSGGPARAAQADGQADGVGAREQLQDIQWNADLEGLIRKLADELDLNVVFDQNFSQVKRNVNIRWKNMTPARALDYVFLSNGLFFQKLDRRTILVADQSKRPMYQQLVLRTFYLYNIKPEDAQRLLSQSLPANAGRQPQFVTNPQTNSITVRDTPENIRIVEQLLKTVDKDRSEVVMEVSIYEISRNDLLQLGNQIGSQSELSNLAAVQPGSILWGGARQLAGAATGSVLPLSTGVGLLIPTTSLQAFQSRTNTRLLFSTAVHAFDDEKSSTRVGSKVPVQTASVYNGLLPTSSGTGTGTGGTSTGVNNAFSNGYPVIQYEDVGLNLDFKPKVYPNQDVQVSMSIESKDEASGPDPLTPIFTQRKIEGVARIPNGRTMMIASIAQDRQTNGRSGLPLLGLIPILGRVFTAPNKNDQQSDIVITMTPRVLRAPEITPEDLKPTDTGTMQTPQSPSLEALVREADKEDQYARLRTLPTNQNVQLPAQSGEELGFVPAPKALAGAAVNSADTTSATSPSNATDAASGLKPVAINLNLNTTPVAQPAVLDNSNAAPPAVATGAQPKPAGDANAKPATNDSAPATQPAPANSQPSSSQPAASNAQPATSNARPAAPATNTQPAASVAPAESTAELLLLPEQQEMKVGERRRLMLFLKTDAPLGLATATLRFDPKTLAVRSISQGVFTSDKSLAPVLTQSVDPSGVLLVSVSPAAGAQPLTGEGLLVVVEVEALAQGDASLQFDADKVHLIATDGRTVRPQVSAGKFKVTQ